MSIETERLLLISLSPKQLNVWTEDLSALERDLRCSYQAEPLEGGFLEVVRGKRKSGETIWWK